MFTDGRWAANGGLGVRVAYKEENAFGLNVYYDFRNVHHIRELIRLALALNTLRPTSISE